MDRDLRTEAREGQGPVGLGHEPLVAGGERAAAACVPTIASAAQLHSQARERQRLGAVTGDGGQRGMTNEHDQMVLRSSCHPYVASAR